MLIPNYDFNMAEEDFSKSLAVLYYKDEPWKNICRKYCLKNSNHPDELADKDSEGQWGDSLGSLSLFAHGYQANDDLEIEF